MSATFKAEDSYGGDLQVDAQGENLDDYHTSLVNTNQDNFEGSVTMPEGKQYMSVSSYSGSWELKFEGK